VSTEFTPISSARVRVRFLSFDQTCDELKRTNHSYFLRRACSELMLAHTLPFRVEHQGCTFNQFDQIPAIRMLSSAQREGV
jgi:hypothetical protein